MEQIQVLDHGYVALVEHYGSDGRIIESARMSTNKGFLGFGPFTCHCVTPVEITTVSVEEITNILNCKKCNGTGFVSGDEKLLRYLYNHKHMTPFEMAGMIIEVQAPIFVFREWHRHRTQSYNELSARYTPMPDLNYLPTAERIVMQGGSNKQAQSAGGTVSAFAATDFLSALKKQYESAEMLYQLSLNIGVPKELARLCIPVGRYSRMRASANLRNWLAFLTLRMDEAAQWEIRQYANAVASIIKQLFPRTYELFAEYSK